MKTKLFVAMLCSLFTINAWAKSPKTHDSITATGDTLTVFGKQFKIMQDDTGFKFVQAEKLNGKDYRVPVWNKTEDTINGHDIYMYKSNGYFYYGLSRHGYPCYIWLIKQ